MKLKEEIKNAVKGRKDIRGKFAFAHNVDNGTVRRWVYENDDNGKLTTAVSLQIIATELNTKQENLLVVETKKNKKTHNRIK